MKKIIKSAILVIILAIVIVITNYATLKTMNIKIVNEKDNVILVNSFNQNWVYEY